MKNFIYVILLLSFIVNASAQNNQGGIHEENRLFNNGSGTFVIKEVKPKLQEQSVGKETSSAHQEAADTASYALYMNSVKQYGWMRGLGKPISDEHARHLSSYLRFSKKNQAGHWTRVENLNGYGQLENGSMGTYLVNPYDDEDLQTDTEWRDKLKQIVRWEFVGDASGEQCIQENAYDKDGNLVYSYIPVQLGHNRYMGHYVDAWGMPAKLRNEEEAKYVVVKWDDYGYESEVMFIGEDGYPKRNSWGAYIAKYVHDKDGFTLSNMSCAADGSYMRDRAGNSGQKQINNEYGNAVVVTNYDENNELIRIDKDEDYIQSKSAFDEWGREICRTYQLPDGTPDTTRDGVHGYECSYNDHGQLTLVQIFGIDGRPKNYSKNAHSSIRRAYDERGNMTLFELRDADGAFWNNSTDCCLEICKYEGDKIIEQRDYKTTNGRDTLQFYHFYQKGKKSIYEYPLRNEIDVYEYDEDGNAIDIEYFDLNWSPRIDSVRGYHHWIKHVTYSKGISRVEEKYLDLHDDYVDVSDETFRNYMSDTDVYNHSVEINDTLHAVMTRKLFDRDKALIQFQQPRSNDYVFPMGEIGIDIMGEKARTHYEKALYYRCYTGRTIKNKIAYIGAINEYNEIAYALESDANGASAYAFRPLDNSGDLDENGDEIDDSKKFKKTLPYAYVIEVFDSIASTSWGIKSGDVVMRYGEWSYPEAHTDLYYGRSLHRIIFAQQQEEKEMYVMRRNPETNEAECKLIRLGMGIPKDYGFYIYPIVYTQKEKQRYDHCYQDNVPKELSSRKKSYKKTAEGENTIFFRPLRTIGYNQNLFSHGITTEGIVLGLVVQEENGTCHIVSRKELYAQFNSCRFLPKRKIQKIWVTTDLRTIQTVEQKKENSYWDASFWFSNVDVRISKPCSKLYARAEEMMNAYVSQLKLEE